MTKTTTPVPDYDRHAQFRATTRAALQPLTLGGVTVLASSLLGQRGHPDHGTHVGYTEYLCRCALCTEAYAEYRQELRQSNLAHRKLVDGVLVSTLMGRRWHPDHGAVTGTYWYGCECTPCREAKADSRGAGREENLTHLVPRESDGVMVSSLLGTEGYPEHGSFSGADWFGCWCEPCRHAKNATKRIEYTLRRIWPGTPARGALSATARAVFTEHAARPDAPDKAASIAAVLREDTPWPTAGDVDTVAAQLIDAIATPARFTRGSREENMQHRVRRESDGVMVSSLLGTEGYPEHGTYWGTDWFGCGCEPCRWTKNTLERVQRLLRRLWPTTPERGEVFSTARAAFTEYTERPSADDKAVSNIAAILRNDTPWPLPSEADAVAAQIISSISGSAKGAA